MKGARLDELELPPMVINNQDPKQTAFTVSVDVKVCSRRSAKPNRAARIRAKIRRRLLASARARAEYGVSRQPRDSPRAGRHDDRDLGLRPRRHLPRSGEPDDCARRLQPSRPRVPAATARGRRARARRAHRGLRRLLQARRPPRVRRAQRDLQRGRKHVARARGARRPRSTQHPLPPPPPKHRPSSAHPRSRPWAQPSPPPLLRSCARSVRSTAWYSPRSTTSESTSRLCPSRQ